MNDHDMCHDGVTPDERGTITISDNSHLEPYPLASYRYEFSKTEDGHLTAVMLNENRGYDGTD